MKKRDDKEKDFQAIREILQKNPHYLVTGFQKMTVAQDYDLRKTIRGAGGNYRVIKNNLATKAMEGTPAGDMFAKITGMTSVAYTSGDPVGLAKALTEYAKKNALLTFKAGVVEGRVIDVSQIESLANMPSKEELLSKLLFLLNSGAQRLAVSLNGVARNLAVVIDQAGKEGKFGS
jgi:large subunit ribosomal protein L10